MGAPHHRGSGRRFRWRNAGRCCLACTDFRSRSDHGCLNAAGGSASNIHHRWSTSCMGHRHFHDHHQWCRTAVWWHRGDYPCLHRALARSRDRCRCVRIIPDRRADLVPPSSSSLIWRAGARGRKYSQFPPAGAVSSRSVRPVQCAPIRWVCSAESEHGRNRFASTSTRVQCAFLSTRQASRQTSKAW